MRPGRERRVEQEMTRCRHFNGIQHQTCDVGIAYRHVRIDRDKVAPGVPFGFPCIDAPDVRTCPRRELLTREQAEAAVAEREAAVDAFLAKTRLGVCGTCGNESTDWQQNGNCIYSLPCGHRVGQGNAAKYRAGVLAARAERTP